MSIIDPNATPGMGNGPNAAALMLWAAANTSVYGFSPLTTTAAIKAALQPLLAQLTQDHPIPNLAAFSSPSTRCLTNLASIIQAIV